jgi:CubicO group peptidase (beta-lactamase class C family)
MNRSFLLLLLAFFLVGCSVLPAVHPTPSAWIPPTASLSVADQETSSRLDTYLTSNAGTGQDFTGSVLVARDGVVLLDRGYGEANRELGLPNAANSEFRIASITKQFTAMAVMILQARHELDVEDHICDYFSDCPSAWQGITIHHLLTHTSGIPDYYSSPDWVAFQAMQMSPVDIMAHFKDEPLDFPPGEKWQYSNSGFILLGVIIEKVSGSTYAAFIKENIFDKLGMENTGFLKDSGSLSIGYDNATDTVPASDEDLSGLFSSGGLVSSVSDLYLFDQALFADTLIPEDLRLKMLTPYVGTSVVTPEGYGLSYGYGSYIGTIAGHRAVGHMGRIEGFISFNFFFPDEKVAVIVLSNQHDLSSTIGIKLANIVFSSK